jgi:hypothetical protein
MDDFDLTGILDDGTGPDATHDVLRRIVARQRARQAHRYRVVATSAVVVVLACAGIGVRLDQSRSAHLSTAGPTLPSQASLQAPAGLRWDVQNAVNGSAVRSSSAGLPDPGQFGFSGALTPNSLFTGPSLQANGALEFGPRAKGAGPSYGPDVPASCSAKGCDIVFRWGIPRPLFTRHVDGLTLTVSLLSYDFPTTIAAAESGSAASTPPVASTNPVGSPASPTSASVPPSARPGIVHKSGIPVALGCIVKSELLVTVSFGSVTKALFVPAGGVSAHPFSVVASAGTSLGDRDSVVIAVADTSTAVASVSAVFAGGGSDAVAPRDGWAVLARRLGAGASLSRAGGVTLVASSSSHDILETAHLPATGSLAAAPAMAVCHYLVVPVNAVKAPHSPGNTPTVLGGGSGASGSAGAKPSS